MQSCDIISRLEKDGWKRVRTTGSQWHFRHLSKPGTVTVHHAKKDMAKGALKSIEKQAGITL